jgi:hypothetical protein
MRICIKILTILIKVRCWRNIEIHRLQITPQGEQKTNKSKFNFRE